MVRRRSPTLSDTSSPAEPARQLLVNGVRIEARAAPGATLLEVLRTGAGQFDVKEACGRGECGACTVLVGDAPVHACTTLAALVDEPVETPAGLATETADLRQRFADSGGFQCGFCTPGLVARSAALLRRACSQDAQQLSYETVAAAISGNICRCTGYRALVMSILEALANHDAEEVER